MALLSVAWPSPAWLTDSRSPGAVLQCCNSVLWATGGIPRHSAASTSYLSVVFLSDGSAVLSVRLCPGKKRYAAYIRSALLRGAPFIGDPGCKRAPFGLCESIALRTPLVHATSIFGNIFQMVSQPLERSSLRPHSFGGAHPTT